MSDILEPIVYLSQEVGPRPAGTEEEQQAALYITEAISKEAGLSTVIEDFRGIAFPAPLLAILCLIAVVISIVSTAFPVVDLASVIVTALVAVVFFTESFDKPILSRLLSRGVSQNVVAKYEPHLPSESGAAHPRKVVLVARYDSGKVSRETSKGLVTFLPLFQWFTLISVIALPILLLLRTIFFPQGGGLSSSIVNILIIITLIGTILPSVQWLLNKLAPYNEAANCNAAGVAVLIEAANRVGQGRVNEALITELSAQEEPVIHGEEEAYAAGVVPDGAELVYETEGDAPNTGRESDASDSQKQSSEHNLAAAKAAIAAMTGRSIPGAAATFEETFEEEKPSKPAQEPKPTESESSEPLPGEGLFDTAGSFNAFEVKQGEGVMSPAGSSSSSSSPLASQAAFYAAPESVSQSSGNVPDWYVKAQEKAKKPKGKERPIQRSKYASALDAAVRESAGHFAEANQIVDHRLEETLNAGLDYIQEVPAPGIASPEPKEELPNPWRDRREAAEAAAELQAEPVNLGETTEMAPLDVFAIQEELATAQEELQNFDDLNTVAMPSFMDPRKVQEEALAAQAGEIRSTTRVAVSEDETVETLQDEETTKVEHVRRQPGEEQITTREAGERPERQENYLEEAQQTFADRVMQRRRARRPVVLPEMDESTPKPAPVSSDTKQRAPLAAGAGNKEAAKSLLTLLPAITADDIVASHGGIENAQADPLLQALPSLSGSIARLSSQPSGSITPVTTVAPAGLTGTFAPVGEELVESMDPDDMYVEDVDDSAYDETFADSGAIASGEYLEMPKSRVSKFFGRFRHKKEEAPEVSAQEWLDVAEDFDPRAEGARRGGWESFQNQNERAGELRDAPDPDEGTVLYDEYEAYDKKSSWEGGAYNTALNQQARRVESADLDSEDIAEEAALAAAAPVEVDEELRQIYAFRNPEIDAEVWFVALGAELGTHDGMRAFLSQHESELRGAILIDLDALGAGELTMIESEGVYEQTKISSRLTRYAKKASQAAGVPLRTSSIAWETSAATYAMRHGIQAMHLVGMDGKKPAYYGQIDDTVENINVAKLEQNTNFVMEILKSI